MPATKLPNYVRTYRKHAGLSQDEVAYLLGCRSGTKVSRYENFSRKPTLETVFAYEAAFGVSAKELFAGIYQKVERKVIRRAKLLARKLAGAQASHITAHKLKALKAITSGPPTLPAENS